MRLLKLDKDTVSDIAVVSAAFFFVRGGLSLFLHDYFWLQVSALRGATESLELGAAIFGLFLLVRFVSRAAGDATESTND